MSTTKPTIKASEFTTDVNSGMTKGQLKEKYGVSDATVKHVAKRLKLTIKRASVAKYELIFDELPSNINTTISYTEAVSQLESVNSLNN